MKIGFFRVKLGVCLVPLLLAAGILREVSRSMMNRSPPLEPSLT